MNKTGDDAKKKIKDSNQIGVIKKGSTVLTNDTDKAELFSSTFHNSFVMDDGNSPSFSDRTSAIMELPYYEPHIIEVLLFKLHPKINSSPDGIPFYVLKKLATSIALPLSIIFHESLETGSIPDLWKTATIRPIFKKGSKAEPVNYRPISLTSSVSKVIEKLLRNDVIHHLTANKLLINEQFGFRSRRNTELQLLAYQGRIIESFQQSSHVTSVYIDFSKAFDTVSIPKLISKLSGYGIRGKLLSWFAAFLSHRNQKVRVNDSFSDVREVLSGVPQGSVLGPLLFLLFINDVADDFKSDFFLYADDLKILSTSPPTIQKDLDILADWCDTWQMKTAPSKCEVINFSKGRNNKPYNQISLKLKSSKLPITKHICDLGVLLTNDLSFNLHITTIVRRCHQRMNIQCREMAEKLKIWRAEGNSPNYKDISSRIKNQLKQEEKNNHEKRLMSGSSKDFFRFFNTRYKDNQEIGIIKNDNDIPIHDEFDKAELFSNCFSNVSTHDNNNFPNINSRTTAVTDEVCFEPYVVEHVLSKLVPKINTTPENIPAIFLKKTATSVALPLSIIFKESFRTSTAPIAWKTAIVKPLFKKGSRSDPNNYRPISLTSSVSKSYGICDELLKWLCAFLTNRTQKISINGIFSTEKHVLSGVPQGSVLGPLLFLLFINDIGDHFQSNFLLYADDLKLFSNDPASIQNDINTLSSWCRDWQMSVAPNKCEAITFTLKKRRSHMRNAEFFINNQRIPKVSKVRDLGVILSSDLSFSPHLDTAIRKANQRVNLLFNVLRHGCLEIFVKCFTIYVRPLLEYGSLIFSPVLKDQIKRIESVQKSFIYHVFRKFSIPYISYFESLSYCNLETLEKRRLLLDLSFLYKLIVSKEVLIYDHSFISLPSLCKLRRHPHFIRSNISNSSKPLSQFLCNRVLNCWNSLPSHFFPPFRLLFILSLVLTLIILTNISLLIVILFNP
ncbi:hypothetical protein CAEBREN_17288 [Caenorhabditis brenneri]|uniref:Reverse transcriptase domain-containing protein n=1 Tax=Caenorhabditis brenneri TaxID=135651 RepID=G0P424_CAEBE|nr:hypothetical protein CAEBREN_17288 [Caenorhabditis brenneri]